MPAELADTLTRWAEDGRILSVSGYIAESVRARIGRDVSLARLEEVFGAKPPADALAKVLRRLGRPDLIDGAA